MELTASTFVRLRPDLQLLEDDEIVLCGDAGLAIHQPPAPLRQILRGLARPSGVAGAQVLAMASHVLTVTLGHLHKAELLQFSTTGFASAQSNTAAYFDATLLRPDAEQRVAGLGIVVVGCGGTLAAASLMQHNCSRHPETRALST